MACLKKRGSSYQIQYYIGGKQKRIGLGAVPYQVAREKLRQFESAQFRDEALPMPTRTPIAGVVGAYVDHICTIKTAKIHHSDRGSQYASGSFRKLLADHGIACSMSRKGDCYDNAMMESFFITFKTELDEPMVSRVAARRALFDYIEAFYNRQRLHSALDYKSPAAYEQQHQAA